MKSISRIIYTIFDDYTAYEVKKQEVLRGTDRAGTQIMHHTANQEGCESATLEIINGVRTLIIRGYYQMDNQDE